MNLTGVVRSVRLASSTKDSLHLQWRVDQLKRALVSGYRVRYQAVGSNVVQFSPLLANTKTGYDIAMLHEDTNYDVCVQVYANGTDDSYAHECIQASTSTDSLTVALGSTFGAFLALGIIVMFVFVAKWQHQRRQRKLELQRVSPSGDESFDSVAQADGDYEMSDVSLQVHDDAAKLEFSSQSSQAMSATANGTLHASHRPPPDVDVDGELDGNVTVHEPPDLDSLSSADSSPQPSTSARSEPVIVGRHDDDDDDDDAAIASLLHCSQSPYEQQRPADVRPKDKALLDLTYMYANKKLFEQPQTQLRPNMSCNW